MPLTPQTQAVLAARAASPVAELYTLSPEQAREAMLSVVRAGPKGEEVSQIKDRTIPGPGGNIPVRIYRPESVTSLPVLVYFHGGGWVIGDIETHDGICRSLANAAGMCIVSVDYRLAPEAHFPAAADDCFAATQWVQKNADNFGGDPERIAVGGDSAGGNLATVVCLMAADKGVAIPKAQVLVYPATQHDFGTASYQENGGGELGLSEASMRWFWNHYLATPADGDNVYASPMRCQDMSGLPPALVITAEYDPLRDEAHDYADRLTQAGIRVERTLYLGVVHGFLGQAALVPEGPQAIEEIAIFLKNTL